MADRICGTIAVRGESGSDELSAEAKADVNATLGKLVDFGVKGAVSKGSTEYTGLLQKDLVAALKDNSTCKLEVLRTMTVKLDVVTKTPVDLEALMQDTAWSVAGYGPDGQREAPHPVPWIFHPNHTVGAAGHWTGSWEKEGSQSVRIHIPQTNDSFAVEFVSPTEFVGYKNGGPYRWGQKMK
jgi:hypothetical protein